MPTYEYICKACKHEWEQEQRVKDEPEKKCPKCEKLEAKRQIAGRTGFVLNGKCWAKDSYA
jgi:putative FmdB family regulatory protein